MKKDVITMAGALGSGKSSTANGVAQALGYRRFSAGDFQRATAASLGLPYDEYQKVALNDPKYDRMADDALIAAGDEHGVVIDARLGYHFIPGSFRVFLTVDPRVAAARIIKDAESNPNRHTEMSGGIQDVDTIVKSIETRLASEFDRYREHYGITDLYDQKHFDLIIDTEHKDLPTVIKEVVEKYQAWLKS